jgi:DNA-directed RNA polymerase specialized sigma subunit
MEDCNTRKLISLYRRTGSKKALFVLVNNHQNSLHYAIQSIPHNLIDYDSQFSIANTVLLNCINFDFNVKNKIKFNTYLINILKSKVIDKIRKEKKNVNIDNLSAVSSNDLINSCEDSELKEKLFECIPKLNRTLQIIIGRKVQVKSNSFITE